MVYFTCNHCGASLKKSNVEKHYSIQCRGPAFVTCVDCLKDFRAEAYAAHTKCITENEKYSAKGFTSHPPSFKGEAKHNAWVDLVNRVSQTRRDIPPIELSFLDSLVMHENIPQKKAKFQNFAKNVWRSGRFHSSAVEFVWNLLEAEFKALKRKDIESENNSKEENKSTQICDLRIEKLSKKDKKDKCKNEKCEELLEVDEKQQISDGLIGSHANEVPNDEAFKRKQKRKRKMGHVDDDKTTEMDMLVCNGKIQRVEDLKNLESIGRGQEMKMLSCKEGSGIKLVAEGFEEFMNVRFSWSKTIIDVLESALDHELPVKRLRKKVLAKFVATGREVDASISVKFIKKLKKMSTVSLLNDRAKLKMY